MTRPAVAVFCMAETGHFKQLQPLISDLVQKGFSVHVFTHRRFGPYIKRAAAKLVDIFAENALDRADNQSVPIPSRYVTFAGAYGDDIVAKVRAIGAKLIVCETFAVVGRVAAQVLGIPFVNISTGHNVDPAQFLPILSADPRVAISDRCHRAVETLRDEYGLGDASPFCYVTGLSPFLNICSQPPQFLSDPERKVFEPLDFYGCLPSESDAGAPEGDEVASSVAPAGGLRIYACFGTTVLRYYADAAFGVLQALSECVENMPEARALVSLGGTLPTGRTLDPGPNVKVVDYTDQGAALRAADVFITHHGINSTHEAIFHRVPMLSYPFFWDQPGLARKCQEFGIAAPLAEAPRRPVTAGDIRSCLQHVIDNRPAFRSNLERTHVWERNVIAARPSVIRRIEEFC